MVSAIFVIAGGGERKRGDPLRNKERKGSPQIE